MTGTTCDASQKNVVLYYSANACMSYGGTNGFYKYSCNLGTTFYKRTNFADATCTSATGVEASVPLTCAAGNPSGSTLYSCISAATLAAETTAIGDKRYTFFYQTQQEAKKNIAKNAVQVGYDVNQTPSLKQCQSASTIPNPPKHGKSLQFMCNAKHEVEGKLYGKKHCQGKVLMTHVDHNPNPNQDLSGLWESQYCGKPDYSEWWM